MDSFNLLIYQLFLKLQMLSMDPCPFPVNIAESQSLGSNIHQYNFPWDHLAFLPASNRTDATRGPEPRHQACFREEEKPRCRLCISQPTVGKWAASEGERTQQHFAQKWPWSMAATQMCSTVELDRAQNIGTRILLQIWPNGQVAGVAVIFNWKYGYIYRLRTTKELTEASTISK